MTSTKPEEKKRSRLITIRLTEDQWTMFTHAAEADGVTMSAWAAARLTRAARLELNEAAKTSSIAKP